MCERVYVLSGMIFIRPLVGAADIADFEEIDIGRRDLRGAYMARGGRAFFSC